MQPGTSGTAPAARGPPAAAPESHRLCGVLGTGSRGGGPGCHTRTSRHPHLGGDAPGEQLLRSDPVWVCSPRWGTLPYTSPSCCHRWGERQSCPPASPPAVLDLYTSIPPREHPTPGASHPSRASLPSRHHRSPGCSFYPLRCQGRRERGLITLKCQFEINLLGRSSWQVPNNGRLLRTGG